MKLLLLLLAALLLCGCTHSQEKAERLLKAEGVSDVKLTGYSWLGCGGEELHTSFQGTKNGVQVKGVICGSAFWGKANTIRYE